MSAADPDPKPSPKALEGSREAVRAATVILETLGGLRSTQEASEVLEVALARYYVLETRALQGMVEALEPRTRGRKPDPSLEIARLREEIARLEREVLRYQALHRASQRAIGLPKEDSAPAPRGGKRKAAQRRVRRKSRGERVLSAISKRSGKKSPPPGGAGTEDPPAKSREAS